MRFQRIQAVGNARLSPKGLAWVIGLASLAALAIAPAVGDGLQESPNVPKRLPPSMDRVPDSNEANQINTQEARKRSFERINAERKRERRRSHWGDFRSQKERKWKKTRK